MKCSRCHREVMDGEKFCPYCGNKMEVILSTEQPVEQRQPEKAMVELSNEKKMFSVVKNKIEWNIPNGVVACRISDEAFSSMDNASGLIVQSGTTALILVDGKEVAQLSEGVYDFISNDKIDFLMDKRVQNWKSLAGIAAKTCRGLVRMVTGIKVKEQIDGKEDYDFKSMDDIIQYLNKRTNISCYLKRDGFFTVDYDSSKLSGLDGKPQIIMTRHHDAQVGIRLMMHITDIHAFIKEYMVGADSVRVTDIADRFGLYITSMLKEVLQDEELNEFGMSKETKTYISRRLMELNSQLSGIEIVKVCDIVCATDDLQRFRELNKELYASEQEMDYLQRTNAFKNRLVGVVNEQKLKETRSDFELQKALDEINKDGLLHENELEQFRVLLSRQKRICNAQNNMEEEKALMDVAKTRLLNKDELEAFALSVKTKTIDRDNINEAMRLQSFALRAKKEKELQEDLNRFRMNQEDSSNELAFIIRKKQYGRALEQADLEDALYGRKHAFNVNRKTEEQELQNLEDDFLIGRNEKAAVHQNTLKGIALEGNAQENEFLRKKALADAQTEKTINDIIRENTEADYALEKRKEDDKWERIRQSQERGLDVLARIKSMKEQEKQKDHERIIEIRHEDREDLKLKQEAELHRIDNEHLERMKALENEASYNAEQLFVNRLGHGDGMNSEAAKVMAESFSSKKTLEANLWAQEKIERERREALERADREREKAETQRDKLDMERMQMYQQMMQMQQQTMGGMMNLMGNVTAGQHNSERECRESMERISTARMGDIAAQGEHRAEELREMKEEYRSQMMHEQERHDVHQDRALSYTTKLAETESKYAVPHPVEVPKQPTTYLVEAMGNVPFQLSQLTALVQNGILHKESVLTVDGRKCYAGDVEELKVLFEKNEMVICPNCHNKVRNVKFCSECGYEL